MVKNIVFVMALLVSSSLFADSIIFRGGNILEAEVSNQRINIANLNKDLYSVESQQSYAMVTVRLSPRMTLGVHDYSLEVFGKKYACVAIRVDNGSFDAANLVIENTNTNSKYAMLFMIDGQVIGRDEILNLNLVCNAEGEFKEVQLPVKNLGGRAFSSANQISNDGNFKLVNE